MGRDRGTPRVGENWGGFPLGRALWAPAPSCSSKKPGRDLPVFACLPSRHGRPEPESFFSKEPTCLLGPRPRSRPRLCRRPSLQAWVVSAREPGRPLTLSSKVSTPTTRPPEETALHPESLVPTFCVPFICKIAYAKTLPCVMDSIMQCKMQPEWRKLTSATETLQEMLKTKKQKNDVTDFKCV